MADIAFSCPSCGQNLEAPDDMQGEQIHCPSCNRTIAIPRRPTPRARMRFWSMTVGVPVLFVTILGLALYFQSDFRILSKASALHHRGQFQECLNTLDRVSLKNRTGPRFVYIFSDSTLNLARDNFERQLFDMCLQRLAAIPATFQKYDEVSTLKSKCEAEISKRLLSSQIEKACSLFNDRQFVAAQAILDGLSLTEDKSFSAVVKRLRDSLQFRQDAERQLPMHPLVTKEAISIREPSGVPVNRGLVRSLCMTNVRKEIYLHNPSQDKVKPDVRLLILNKDGVVILQHSESWLVKTLDYDQSHTVSVNKQFEFPTSLAFSKWGVIGWDITPAYALCVGSKTSYDRLKDQIEAELQHIQRTPPVITQYPYALKDFLPEVVPFSFNTTIRIVNSTIVDSLSFSRSQVQISYHNQSEMRIKPNIIGYVFNRDGVIIASFHDSWSFFSLAPDERKQEAKPLSFRIPDELVFSRWARTTYDVEPAWFLLAGSSKQFDDLIDRTEKRIKQLNRISISER